MFFFGQNCNRQNEWIHLFRELRMKMEIEIEIKLLPSEKRKFAKTLVLHF